MNRLTLFAALFAALGLGQVSAQESPDTEKWTLMLLAEVEGGYGGVSLATDMGGKSACLAAANVITARKRGDEIGWKIVYCVNPATGETHSVRSE